MNLARIQAGLVNGYTIEETKVVAKKPYSDYCSCSREACVQNHPREQLVSTRIQVAGFGDVKALGKSLESVAIIEPFDFNGCYMDEYGNFQISVLGDGEESKNLVFALHTITDHGFQIVDIKSPPKHHIRCALFQRYVPAGY